MTAFTEAVTERALGPLDELRGAGLRALAGQPLARAPFLRAMVRRRSTRIPVLISVHGLAAWLLAVFAAPFLLVVGPLFLAVPHVAAGLRHLVVRRAWPRWWLAGSALFAIAMLATRLLALGDPRRAAPLFVEQGLGAAWIVFSALSGALVGKARRSGFVLAGALALAAVAVAWPRASRVALVHGHNLVALVLWASLFRRGNRLVWLPVAIVLAGAVVLGSGALIPFTVRHGLLSFAGLHLFAAADWLAPGLPDAAAIALAMSFAFLQSAHYAVWLAGVPAADRPGEGARSLRVAARAFAADFGTAGAVTVVGLAGAVAAAGLLHPDRAQRLVLSLGMFHAWLELAVAAYVLAVGAMVPQRRREARSAKGKEVGRDAVLAAARDSLAGRPGA